MTSSIIDVIRHSHTPASVLGRGIPRFEPCELHDALTSLRERFGHDAHFLYPETLCALWNAHHQHLLWQPSAPTRPLNTRTPKDQWGLAFARKKAVLWLYMDGIPFPMELSVDSPHTQEVTLVFNDPHMTNTHLSLYVRALKDGLKEAGANEPDWSWKDDGEGTSYPTLYIQDIKTCAQQLESLVLGDGIYRLDEATQTHQPGPRIKALEAQDKQAFEARSAKRSASEHEDDLPF